MLNTLADIVLACSTVFLQANTSLSNHESLQEVATVLSSRPWQTLDFVKTPDCATVVVDETWLQALAVPIARSRTKASLVLSTQINELMLAFVLKSNKNLNFDAHIVSSMDSFQDDIRIVSIHTKDEFGRALRRDLTATYVMMVPYIINPTPPNPTGLDPDIIDILSKSLNIKFTLKWVKDFTENIRDVLYGKSDMALSQPTFVYQRYRLGIDISPALTLRTFFFIKRHPVPADSMYTISLPFSKSVWLALVCSIVAIGAALALLNSVYGIKPCVNYVHISISYITVVSESMPYEWFKERRHTPYFIIMYIWLLLGFLLAQAYRSNLLANLVKVDYEDSPETFQDLLDMEMGVYLPEGTVMTLLLRDSPFEVHRKVYQEGIEKRGGFLPEALPPPKENQRVQDGLAVGVATDDTLAAFKHMYVIGKEPFYAAYIGFYYFLKLPIKDEIDQALLALQEAGVIDKLRDKNEWLLSKLDRIRLRKDSITTPVIIGMSHVLPMLIGLGFGLALTLLIFIPEFNAKKLYLSPFANTR